MPDLTDRTALAERCRAEVPFLLAAGRGQLAGDLCVILDMIPTATDAEIAARAPEIEALLRMATRLLPRA